MEVAEALLHILDLNNEETQVCNLWINDRLWFSTRAPEANGEDRSICINMHHVKVLSSTPLDKFG